MEGLHGAPKHWPRHINQAEAQQVPLNSEPTGEFTTTPTVRPASPYTPTTNGRQQLPVARCFLAGDSTHGQGQSFRWWQVPLPLPVCRAGLSRVLDVSIWVADGPES